METDVQDTERERETEKLGAALTISSRKLEKTEIHL